MHEDCKSLLLIGSNKEYFRTLSHFITHDGNKNVDVLDLDEKPDKGLKSRKRSIILAYADDIEKTPLQIIEQIKSFFPDTPIIILHRYIEFEFAVNLLRTGVKGYLPSNASLSEILEAVNAVCEGKLFISKLLR